MRYAASLFMVIGLLVRALEATEAPQQPTPPTASPQAKIVAVQGRVERAPDQQDVWNNARLFEELFPQNRVRTLVASRAAILFLDETQVKLNANAILTVQTVRRGSGDPTTLNLLRGEGWFRTKNPASGVTIRTPAAAATIRGTEINVAIGPADETVLTVVEGSAELSNTAGSLLVLAGEEGTARVGEAPIKRVVLNPEDAVQWTLYYPARVAWRDLPPAALAGPARAGFDRLRARDAAGALTAFQPLLPADDWARIGASIAYIELGNSEQARLVLDAPAANPAIDVERRAQRAAAALAIGDAPGARREIEAALALDPAAIRPRVLLATLELTQNRADQARQAAEAALAARADSVGALLAASEAAQAVFDLSAARRYLDRAVALDPDDVAARVNRARILFGAGDTGRARRDVDHAAGIAPADPQVLSLTGFITLADGDATGARTRFDAAVTADPDFGEPHLGLGLVHFKERRVNDGLLEMLTATLLEPKISLYQSYLGKAYYQALRFPEGLSALATAKRLDPRDPTPWLYTSLFLRDQNQQVEALGELRHAIALNDNRAVYRSRLLLDRDLATKNISLAEIYGQLGFDAWGAFEAQNSLDTDLTNASAHLFLGETYGRLGDRTQALGSELLQYFLYAPVNRNSFNNFNEYTALIEQPARQLAPTVSWGNDGQTSGSIVTRSGNDRLAHIAAVSFEREDGVRSPGDDEARRLFVQAKLALNARSDVFFFFSGSKDQAGQSPEVVRTLGSDSGAPVIVRQFIDTPDRTLTNRFDQADTTVGFKHEWRPGSTFTAANRIVYFEQRTEDPDGRFSSCRGIDLAPFGAQSSSRLRFPFLSYNIQAQQAIRLGRHQLIIGTQLFEQEKERHCDELVFSIGDRIPIIELTDEADGHDRTVTGYVRDEIQLASWLHVTAGLRYEDVTYADIFVGQRFDVERWNPLAGVSIQLAPSTVLRLAAFRNLNSDFTGAKISPSTVSGFVIERNEQPTAVRKEANASLEHGWARAFVGIRGFRRDTTVPALTASFLPEAESRALGTSAFFNLIASRRVSLFADDLVLRDETRNFDRTDHQVRLGVNFIHERGVFVRLATGYITQRFSNTAVTELPRSSFSLTDLELKYEFGGKRGLLTFRLTNAFDRRFATIVEGLSVEQPRPDRRALALFRWRL